MKKKVLVLQGTLSAYNVPTFNIIAQRFDLTVAYTVKNECKEEQLFKIIKLEYKKICGLFFIRNGFYSRCSNFDVVVFLCDLHYFSYCSLPFIKRSFKVIPWTIGIRASYERKYDLNRKKDFIDRLYGNVLKKSDAMLFYMKDPILFWEGNINKNKIFVAHNTVDVEIEEVNRSKKKNRILFIGTLYKAKKIYELIDAYIEAKDKCDSDEFLYLDIIGDGEEYTNIKSIIQTRGLSSFIKLCGPIYDDNVLADYFSKSILCISPNQAGLSVLKSMGYGVPYVTRFDAITGGERLNIVDKKNGFLYNNKCELVSIILDAYKNPEYYLEIGNAAQSYYFSNATIRHMAQGFFDAIDYVSIK